MVNVHLSGFSLPLDRGADPQSLHPLLRANYICACVHRRVNLGDGVMGVGEGATEEVRPDRELDCIGLYCPVPIARTKEEIEKIRVGEVLKVEADDPAAEEDITRWAKRTGHEIVKFEKSEGILTFYIRRTG